jgi:hypothetical protein
VLLPRRRSDWSANSADSACPPSPRARPCSPGGRPVAPRRWHTAGPKRLVRGGQKAGRLTPSLARQGSIAGLARILSCSPVAPTPNSGMSRLPDGNAWAQRHTSVPAHRASIEPTHPALDPRLRFMPPKTPSRILRRIAGIQVDDRLGP